MKNETGVFRIHRGTKTGQNAEKRKMKRIVKGYPIPSINSKCPPLCPPLYFMQFYPFSILEIGKKRVVFKNYQNIIIVNRGNSVSKN